MDGTKFAKMLSDKHLFELDRMAYKYSAADVREFSEILRQNFAQPLPLVDFAGQAIVCPAKSTRGSGWWILPGRLLSACRIWHKFPPKA